MEKQTNIYDLAQQAYSALSSGGEWPRYLRSAAWNFRFNFPSQVMIWAQRPEATACYSFEEWHNRFNRRKKSGAKGIALLDDRKDQLSMSYVFDYSDTYSPEGKHITPWQLTAAKEPAVRRVLIREFMPDAPGVTGDVDAMTFYSSAVYSILEDKLAETLPDLMSARPGCRLSEVSEAKAEEFYRFLLLYSTTAIVMHRCGLEPKFPDYVFENVQYFDSIEAMSVLGTTVQHLSKQILREVALTVAAWDKEHAHEQEEERSNERESDLSAGRGVSDPEPDHSEQSGTPEQVQQNAEEIPSGTQGEPVHEPSDLRHADGPSDPNRENDPGTGGQDHPDPSEEGPGAPEGQSGLGTAHGEPAHAGGGAGLSGDDLPVNYFTVRQIEEVLLRAPMIEAGKYRIQRAVEENSEDLHLTLIDEFGAGGRFLFQDGTEGFIRCDASGIHLRADNYNPTNITWKAADTRIRALVAADRFLDEQEKIQCQRYFEAQEQLHKRQEVGETLRVFASVYGPKDHDFNRQFQEDLRAYVYEHSETARVALLKTIGSLSEHPRVKEDAEAVALITQTLNALGADTRQEDSPTLPSATDAGIPNPFPTEEELAERKAQRNQPLNREPLDDIPDFAQNVEPAPEPSDPAAAPLAEGEVLTLAGTDYVILRADQNNVTIQDAEHPLFTQQLPLSVIQTLLTNQPKAPVKENGITPKPEQSSVQEHVKENAVTPQSPEPITRSTSVSNGDGRAVLAELLNHFEYYQDTEGVRLYGALFSRDWRRMSEVDRFPPDAEQLHQNIQNAAIAIRRLFPTMDSDPDRGRETSRVLNLSQEYLGPDVSLDDLDTSMRRNEWRAGREQDLFIDLCFLCANHVSGELPEEIRALVDAGSIVTLDGADYRIVGFDHDFVSFDEPLVNLTRVSDSPDHPERTSDVLGYVSVLLGEKGPVDYYHAIPALANFLNANDVPGNYPEHLDRTFGQLVLEGLYYEDDRDVIYPDRREELQQKSEPVRNHNPEPEVDHPELVTDRHFPKAREDKDLLSDLLIFANDYAGTFALNHPELSEHDHLAYVQATEFIRNMVVTDDIHENAKHIEDVCNYINAWFLPFSDGIKPELTEKAYALLERADTLDPDELFKQAAEQPAQEQKPASVAASAIEGEEDDLDLDEEGESFVRDNSGFDWERNDTDPIENAGSIMLTLSEHQNLLKATNEEILDFFRQNTELNDRIQFLKDKVYNMGTYYEFGPKDDRAGLVGRDEYLYVWTGGTYLNRTYSHAYSWPEAASLIAARLFSREDLEPSLFDFQYDGPAEPAPQPHYEAPEAEEQIAQPVSVQAAQGEGEQERINFRLPSDTVPLGGPKARYQSNVAAIRLLKQLEAENRLATAQEQEILSKYVGWGGISDAFDPNKSNWFKEYEELKALLTEEEYEAARESTLTAFYTPPEVMDAIYQVLGNLGFQRGNILDPGCGTGSFSGRLPEEMGESRVYGVEKDSISGRIARQLYQKNNITIEGYEDTKLPDNFFDVAVGNVPFGDFKVADKRYDKLNLPIHDYFFAKTLDKVRPGGVVAFITSMGTMDKQSTEFRRYLSQRADLLGAIRLPNNTFKTNAGTDVTSDIIFLQKREAPRVEEAAWVDLDSRYNYETGEYGPEMNTYFAYSPEMILGEMKEISGPHGPELACVAREGQDLKAELKRAAENIVGAISEPEQGLYDQEYEQRESIPADPDVRNYSYTLVDDVIYFREDSEMFKVETSRKGEERIRGLIGLRDIVHALIQAQVDGASDEAVHALQGKLNEAYDAFTAKNGLINSRGNDLAFSDDSSYYLLCSLEHVNDKGEFLGKADMFTKRTIHAHETVDHVDTAQEALAVSLGERGRIDFEYMTELSGFTRDQLAKQLQGQIFQDPEQPGKYEIAALYLSGNVREKLHMARQAEADEPGVWTANVKALQDVQPQDLEPADITVRLGSTWIPKEDYTQFMYELLNTPRWYQEKGSMEVLYSPYTNTWNIKNVNWDDYNTKAITTYGTRRMNAYRILEHTLNLKDVKIYDTVYELGKEKRVLNEEETLEAQEKQQQIKDAFKEWIWSDPDRADRLCKAYNERFNSYVPPKFDGSMVQFHNMRPGVSMRPWQRDAVARIIYNGNTLLAHAVGAGKTWTMSAAAMEMKHLGLCSKSLIVVPNHLVGQWASAIYDQYPNAKVLASTKKDFETKNRKKFCSRIATGDYDVVVIGHSQFERIPLSQERQEAGIRAEIHKVMDGIAELKAEKAEHFTIKQMERMKKTLETRLDRLHNSKKRDDVITFEQLGVDRLFVDESHEYKNLFLYTKMQNVAGISQTDSQKASDMFLKCRYMDELTGNKGIIHATGTPLSNTMAELYATQRYLQYDLLEKMGLGTFDQWASTFGETVTSVELAPEGTGYRARTRFANFFNIPELMSLYCQVTDIQTADMLDLPLPTPHYENVVLPASDIQKDYVKGLGERAQKIRNGSVKPEEDNMLKITSDGRKLALDQRLIDPDWPDDPNSKANACADYILKFWEKYADTKGTQLVFCDISTPNNKVFNVYDDLKEKLVARGIPAEEIRFVHEANTDAQKEALFQQVREGKVRVLMGSTGKMGTGTNVQDLLVAGHDLDCPWRPSDLEQRSGRVIRQGNSNDDVFMVRYVKEGTFDAYMYQLVENKQRFISQIYTSKPAVRQAADVDEIVMSFAEIKALASGNPLIKERVETEGEVQRLLLLKSRHDNAQYRLNRMVTRDLPERIATERSKLVGYEKDVAFIKSRPSRTEDDHLLPVEVKGVSYEKPKDAGEAILKAVKRAAKDQVTPIGNIRGFGLEVDLTERGWDGELRPKLVLRGPGRKYSVGISDSEVGMVHRLNNVLDKDIPEKLEDSREEVASLEHDLAGAKLELGKPFPREAELVAKQARLEELTRKLDLDAREEPSSREEEVCDTDANEAPAHKPSLDSVIQSAQARQATQVQTGQVEHLSEIEH